MAALLCPPQRSYRFSFRLIRYAGDAGKRTGRRLFDAVQCWLADDGPRMGAAIAFYTVFSLAPMLIIAISFAGLVVGREAAQLHALAEVRALLGTDGSMMVATMLAQGQDWSTDGVFAVVGFVTLAFGSTAVFAELQAALNLIWRVPPHARGVSAFLRARLLSFAIVVGVGFLLLTSLLISAGLAAVSAFVSGRFHWGPLLEVLNVVVSFGVITLLFALLFKVLPDTPVAWRDVWAGALFTSFAFNVGKQVIGFYIGKSGVATHYGAAGSLVLIMVWIYYSAQIFLLGAEFTRLSSRAVARNLP